MSGRPISRRPPGKSNAGNSCVTASPAVTKPSAVRIHARNVLSLAYENRTSGSEPSALVPAGSLGVTIAGSRPAGAVDVTPEG